MLARSLRFLSFLRRWNDSEKQDYYADVRTASRISLEQVSSRSRANDYVERRKKKNIIYFCAPNRNPMPRVDSKPEHLFITCSTFKLLYRRFGRSLPNVFIFLKRLRASQCVEKFFLSERQPGQDKINQSAVTFLAKPFFPSKYYRATYTCPTYQNLTYPTRHINVSKR